MTENKITHRIWTAKEGIEKRFRDVGARGPTEGRTGSHGPFDWLEHNLRGAFKR
ncbi:hypothetical protein KO481_41835 [Nocardia sp. NEAU-G5]|uniref:Uncharacterized protein n=1 Tax=Nocardia albiluteola TaxID=2842303 RepID=A0ABS6BCN6_9NOCA|nr:hypothetical protein [Nocardia albiluteola]MBU3068044.1 hypothetical protein [Nocardia albiluteola]